MRSNFLSIKLPPQWEKTTLGKVVEPTRPRINPSKKPDLPFIGMDHIEAQTMRLLGTVPANTMKSSAVHFQPGDVLYGRLRPYLNKVYRPTFEGLCSAEFIVFPEKEGLDNKYLQYFLNSYPFVSFATHLNTGDRPRVKFEQLAPFPFPLPLPEQQRRIVAEIEKQFSRLDEAVANLKRVKANLKRYKAAVLTAAVEGKLTEEWRKEHPDVEPASKLLKRILAERRKKWEEAKLTKIKAKGKVPKDDKWKREYKEPPKIETRNLPELPIGWAWANFEQLAEDVPNALKAGPFGSALKKSFYVPHGFKIYGQEQVIRDDPYYGDYYIDEERYKQLESCAVKPGDMLVSLVGTIGRILVLPDDIEPGIINPRLVKMSLDMRLVEPSFIQAYLQSPYVKYLFAVASHGGTMDILNMTILKGIPIPLPPLEEQKMILNEFERVATIEAELEKTSATSLLRAERLRQSILSKAFSGAL